MLMSFDKKYKYPIIADVADWLSSNGNNLLFDIIKTVDIANITNTIIMTKLQSLK